MNDPVFKMSPSGDFAYIAYRKAVDLFFNRLGEKKAFIAVSTLGNGKSVFCRIVRERLRAMDVDVFSYVKDGVDIDSEIEEICKISGSYDTEYGAISGATAGTTGHHRRTVVIIDDYNAHMDIIYKFASYGTDRITFLLTTRRSNQESNNLSLKRALNLKPEEVMPLFLYKLERNEEEAFATILRDNSLLPAKYASMTNMELADHFHDECRASMASIVLDLFNSSSVKESLAELLRIMMGKSYRRLCILGLASSVMNLHLSYTDMLELLECDYMSLLVDARSSILGEIFNVEDDRFEVSSSVIAKVMLDDIVPVTKLMEVLEIAVKRTDEISPVINPTVSSLIRTDKWTEMIKAILSHRNFEQYLKRDAANIRSIKHFYDSVKQTTFCKNNPFYWEQFAIIYQEAREFVAARQCLENADAVAKRIHGFVPFQICTIRGDMILDETLSLLNEDRINADQCIDRIMDAQKHFMKHYSHPENEHIRVFSNSMKIVQIYDRIKNDLDRRGLSIYIQTATEVVKNIRDYKVEYSSGYSKAVDKWEEEFVRRLEDAKIRVRGM